jgi:hypothetical protein
MKQEPLPDERYEFVCKLLEEIGFQREVKEIHNYGSTCFQQCMTYGNPTQIWGKIYFRIGVDLRTRPRFFRPREHFMKLSFEHGGLVSILRKSISNVGCDKCFIMQARVDKTPYLCVPIECYKTIPYIVKEYYRLDNENRITTKEKQREKNKSEVEEIKIQLSGECR